MSRQTLLMKRKHQFVSYGFQGPTNVHVHERTVFDGTLRRRPGFPSYAVYDSCSLMYKIHQKSTSKWPTLDIQQ